MATTSTITGRRRLGLFLAMVASASWGWLPIVLKLLLAQLNGWTIAWGRFVGSSLGLWLMLLATGRLPRRAQLSRRVGTLIVMASFGLAGNYLGWVIGLRNISPTTAGLVTQLSPLFLAAAAAIVFRERIGRSQGLGFALLLLGLGVFCRDQLGLLATSLRQYSLGVALVSLGSLSWVAYALGQKELLNDLSSQGALAFIYTGSAALLTAGVDLPALTSLSHFGWLLLLAATGNTLLAYGCLGEAFRHCEASRIGAVLPLQPLFTVIFMHFVVILWPGLVEPERLSLITLLGAAAVIGGAAMAALGDSGPGDR